MENTIGLKVIPACISATCIQVFRKHSPLSLHEIRERILNEDYVLLYSILDEEGVGTILDCYHQLEERGICSKIFEDGVPTDVSLIHNLKKMYQEISDEVDSENN